MSVAQILQQMAENAGNVRRQRGALIGNTIADLAQVPGQIQADRAQQQAQQYAQQRLQAQDARVAANDQRAAAADQREDAARQAEQQEQAIASQIMSVYVNKSPNDPTTNDLQGAEAKAQELGRPEWVMKLRTIDAAERKRAEPTVTQRDPAKDTYVNGVLTTPGVAKAPEMGTPANEIYLRQQALLTPPVAAPVAPDFAGPVAPAAAPLTPNQAALQAYDDQRKATAKGSQSPIHKEWTDYKNEGGTLAFDAYMTADANRKRPNTNINVSGMGALYAATDPKAIAAQIRAGEMPPDIGQYGRPVQGAIASILAQKGPNGEKPFNLSGAQREWKAQLKLNSTMNGPQQVRLDESIRSGLAMYDKVDEIAAQWQGKGWGALSRKNLQAAKDGLLGAKAATVANQLEGQIGQLTSDIATIEQGGLTPTNESRAVAEKSMQAWWGEGTIKDMTAQGRYNMQIRHNARNTQEPSVPGNDVDRRPALPATPGGAKPTAADLIKKYGG